MRRPPRGAVIALACMATLTLVGGARALSVTAEGHRRAQEDAAHQSDLDRQLADRDAVLASQRRVYIERFRRLEAEVREREQDIGALRARLAARDAAPVHGAVDRSRGQ